jgi:hypothetical protein
MSIEKREILGVLALVGNFFAANCRYSEIWRASLAVFPRNPKRKRGL